MLWLITTTTTSWKKRNLIKSLFSKSTSIPSGGVYNWDGDGNGATAGTETVRTQEYSAIGWRNVIPSNSLLSEFEKTAKGDAKTDPRYDDSFYFTGEKYNKGANTLTDGQQNGNSSVVDGVTQKVSWQKYSLMYKMNESFLTGAINQRIMRFAETILSLAEVENEAGSTAEAVKYLNMIRARKSVSMPAYPTAKFRFRPKTRSLQRSSTKDAWSKAANRSVTGIL
jgi:hypothetical protein